jgi:hypothetical protein
MKWPIPPLAILILAVFAGLFATAAYGKDGVSRELTDAAKKTLEILRMEKLDAVELDPGEPQKGYELVRERLAKRGVTVRRLHYGRGEAKHVPSGPLALKNIPLNEFMKYFDQWAWWGWLVYPDGSITYFDSQCACAWPKDGVVCHERQYEAGKPEVMAQKEKMEGRGE